MPGCQLCPMLCLSMGSDGTFDQNFEEPVIFACDEIFIVTPDFLSPQPGSLRFCAKVKSPSLAAFLALCRGSCPDAYHYFPFVEDIDSLHLCAVCGVAFLGCTVSSPFIWSRRSVEAVTRICCLIVDKMSTFCGSSSCGEPDHFFHFFCVILFVQAELVTRTCCLIIVNISKFAEDPGICWDKGGVTSLWDGGILWGHA